MLPKPYRGWSFYKPATGANRGLRSLKAKHPARDARLECVFGDADGLTEAQAAAYLKSNIDSLEEVK